MRACADDRSVYDEDDLSGMGGGMSHPQLGQLEAVACSGFAMVNVTVEAIMG